MRHTAAFLAALAGIGVPDYSGVRESLDLARCRLTRVLSAGEDHVFAVSVSRAAKLAAAGRRDGRVTVWDARTWREVRSFEAHPGYCYGTAFSPDGRVLATAGLDGTVKLWDVGTWAVQRTFRASDGAVTALAFSAGGRWLLAGGGTAARVWDAAEGRMVAEIRTEPAGLVAVAASGSRAATADLSGVVGVWDVETGRRLHAMKAGEGCVHAIAFHPGGRWLAAAGGDGLIRIWDAETGREVRALEGHAGAVHALAFASGGRHLVSGGKSGVRVWDFRTGLSIRSLEMGGATAYGVTLGPDGRRIVATGGDNRIREWGRGEGVPPPGEDPPVVGFLGISYVDGEGAVVSAVVEGSQAQRVGLLQGDVIIGVDGEPIGRSEDFLQYMRRSREGNEIHLEVRRGGGTRIIKVKLGRWK